MKLLIGIFVCLLLSSPVWAEPDYEKLSMAIYLAEGGAKTAHPYGIMKHYKVTTPRQACLNTLHHQYRLYLRLKAQGKAINMTYLRYLSTKYAPLGASNDPRGLNANWLSNVRRFYGRV